MRFCLQIIIPFWLFCSAMAAPESVLHQIDSYLGRVKDSESISRIYKGTMGQGKVSAEAQALVEKNVVVLKEIGSAFQAHKSFPRGLIEKPENMNGLTLLLQLEMVRVRTLAEKGVWLEVRDIFSNWFTFASDFPFEESSLIGLRFTGVVRSLLLDELESLQSHFAEKIADSGEMRKWFLRVRAPWPVDRVVLTEARRVLASPYQKLAEKVATAYQKNPYQSAAATLGKSKGSQTAGAELIKNFWRDQDIESMKTEITRISRLKLRFAVSEYEKNRKTKPLSVDALVKEGLLDQAPLDYFTGRPLDLTSL
jgi:hypothetical protein